MTYHQDVIDSLQFVKVVLDGAHMTEPNRAAGYLTDLTCHVLLAELERRGLRVVKVERDVGGENGQPTSESKNST